MLSDEKLIFEGDTELDHYQVVDRLYEGRPARVLFSGRSHSAQSGVARDDGNDLLFDYNQRLLELVNGTYPATVLVIGGGAFTLPMALARALPELVVDVVEIDPGLTKIAQDYFGFQPHERLRVINNDGRRFLDTTRQTYDVIIVDAYSHLTIPASLVSLQAVQAMRDCLNPAGLVAINLIVTYQGRLASALRSHLATYQTVFNQVDIFPAANSLSTWLPQNLLLVAQSGQPRQLKEYLRYAPLELLRTEPDEAFTDTTESP